MEANWRVHRSEPVAASRRWAGAAAMAKVTQEASAVVWGASAEGLEGAAAEVGHTAKGNGRGHRDTTQHKKQTSTDSHGGQRLTGTKGQRGQSAAEASRAPGTPKHLPHTCP